MRHVAIHGHFYQPPREHPALEAIELQPSAAPWHDWNERITAECYAPNTDARILDGSGRIARILDNYGRISFDFGPTLLSWLERCHPEVYRAILAADRESARRFGGHGSAMAQGYNHAILPLANERDRRTQVRWGVRDFEHRFGRPPEGMWLPETAADRATLATLVEHGIRFTILAPSQAATPMDTTRPYWIELGGGRRIAVFFYDQELSAAIAFGGLLRSGQELAQRLAQKLARAGRGPALVHVATDGETYGHHHRFGDLALASALDRFEHDGGARLTNYGEFLAHHPPSQAVELVEPSSWSCAHGVGRWTDDCGCSIGVHPGWHQRWRRPLRQALDALRDSIADPWQRAAGELLHDPWLARDDYIDIVLDRGAASVEGFFERHAKGKLDAKQRTRALELLELQRHALLMYTSCAWFFDDIAGIESTQNLRYADRVLELSERLLEGAHGEGFLAHLALAPSNDPAVGDGRTLYERTVRPGRVGARRVAIQAAAVLAFDDVPGLDAYAAWNVGASRIVRRRLGQARFAKAEISVESRLTGERRTFEAAVLHRGGRRLRVNVTEGEPALGGLGSSVELGNDEAAADRVEAELGSGAADFEDLLVDQRLRLVERELEAHARDLRQRFESTLVALEPGLDGLEAKALCAPPVRWAVEARLRARAVALLDALDPDPAELQEVGREAKRFRARLDGAELVKRAGTWLARCEEDFRREPLSGPAASALTAAVRAIKVLEVGVDLRRTQTRVWQALHQSGVTFADPQADEVEPALRELCELLELVPP